LPTGIWRTLILAISAVSTPAMPASRPRVKDYLKQIGKVPLLSSPSPPGRLPSARTRK
jgi:Sigma-70 factor, region 1.2